MLLTKVTYSTSACHLAAGGVGGHFARRCLQPDCGHWDANPEPQLGIKPYQPND